MVAEAPFTIPRIRNNLSVQWGRWLERAATRGPTTPEKQTRYDMEDFVKKMRAQERCYNPSCEWALPCGIIRNKILPLPNLPTHACYWDVTASLPRMGPYLFIRTNRSRSHPNVRKNKIKEEAVGCEVFMSVQSEAGGWDVRILWCSEGRINLNSQ